jgi:PAS domain S-box-containing protein
MDGSLQILHLEDDPYDVELIHETIKEHSIDCSIKHVVDRESFVSALEQTSFDIILADFALPSFSGQEALTLAQAKYPDVPFIFVSGAIGEELAIETLKLGATDYVLKHRLSRLVPAIKRALREVEERRQRRQAQEQLRQSRDQLEAILSGITEGISVQLPDGRLIYANEMAAAIVGFSSVEALLDAPPSQMVGKFEMWDEWNNPVPPEKLPGRQALQGRKPDEILLRFRAQNDDTDHWSVVNATPIFDEDGRVQFAVNIFRDVTERTRLYVAEKEARQKAEENARRIATLQSITAAFSQALTSQQVAQVVLEQGLTVLGATAGSVVQLNEQENMLEILHAAGYNAELVRSWRRFPLDAPAPLAEAVRTRLPIFLKDANDAGRFTGLLTQTSQGANKSWASIPLLLEDRIVGAMGLSFSEPQSFEIEDREFISALSHHLAQALERARLFEAERAARDEATRLNVELEERVEQRTADLRDANQQLQETNAVLEEEINDRLRAEQSLQLQVRRTAALVRTAAHLNAELELDKVLMAVCEEAARGMQVAIATVSLYDPGRDALVHAMGYGLTLPFQEKLEPLPRSVYEDYIRDKGPLVITPDLNELDGQPNQELYRALGVRSMASVSLMEKGNLVGRLFVASVGEKRQFGANDLALLQGLADQAGSAIQNARLLQEVRSSREQLRRLTQQVVTAQEEERQRLSRELHDELGQVLSVFKISLELMLADLPDGLPEIRKPIGEAVELADAMIEHIRLMAYDLRPPALDTLGLESALDIFCRDFAKRTKIEIEYSGTKLPEVPDSISLTFYRLLQEALTNVIRHSQADKVRVTLDCIGDKLTLSVLDNGQGFDKYTVLSANPRPVGLGLVGMRERVRLLGGSLNIDSEPGQGTRLVASVTIPGP